jgi:polar amino acid transport system substrate-binding protein
MKQVVQNFRTGQLDVEELAPPALRPGGVLVRTACSLISAGTERTIVETAQSSLIGKARGRPDLVRQVFDTLRREGLTSTYEKVKAKLSQSKARLQRLGRCDGRRGRRSGISLGTAASRCARAA